MGKTIKLEDDICLDSSNVIHNEVLLSDLLNNIYNFDKKYYSGTTIDANDFINAGIYVLDINNTISNRPEKVSNALEYLLVITTVYSNCIIQVWFNNVSALFYRTKDWGYWQPWRRIALS